MCFWQAKLLQLAGELQVLSEDVFIQILTDIQGFNAEILPCAPCDCGSGDERLEGDSSVFIVLLYTLILISAFSRASEGALAQRKSSEYSLNCELGVLSSLHLPVT